MEKGRRRRSSIALTSARAQSGAKRPYAGVSLSAGVMRLALWWHARGRSLFPDVRTTGERHFPPLSLIRTSPAGLRLSLSLPDREFVFFLFLFLLFLKLRSAEVE